MMIFSRQRGVTLFAVILFTIVAGFFIATASYIYVNTSDASRGHEKAIEAFYIAEAGLNYAMTELVAGSKTCTELPTTSPVTFGGGEFTIGTTLHSLATTTINSVTPQESKSIPVSDDLPTLRAQGFVFPEGVIRLYNDIEATYYYYRYTGFTTGGGCSGGHTCFVIPAPGINELSYAPPNDTVDQQSCKITVTGFVPTQSDYKARRVLTRSVSDTRDTLVPAGWEYVFS